jgi:hypothetical protein
MVRKSKKIIIPEALSGVYRDSFSARYYHERCFTPYPHGKARKAAPANLPVLLLFYLKVKSCSRQETVLGFCGFEIFTDLCNIFVTLFML